MKYQYKKVLVNFTVLLTILEFYQVMENRYNLEQGLLYYIVCEETVNGRILGDNVVVDVASDVQIKYLNKIAKQLDISPRDFVGSSKGAIGYTQFMPATWWQYKQDGNGDGVRDPRNPYDSIATAGFYIARLIALQDGNVAAALDVYSGEAALENPPSEGEKYSDRVLACVRGRASCPHSPLLANKAH